MALPQGESSPKLGSALAARLSARVHPGWNRVYAPLAILVVVTVILSLYQNRELRKDYNGQIEFINTTNYRTGRLLELQQAAWAIEDPGIDVINLSDIKDAPAKIHNAHHTFKQLMSGFRSELELSSGEPQTATWIRELEATDKAVAQMVSDEEQMFSDLQDKRLERAAQKREGIRARGVEIVSHLTGLRSLMVRAQQSRLDQNLTNISSRAEVLDVDALFSVFLVIGVTAYGFRLSRRIESAERERERYEEALQKSNDELDERVRKRTAELTNTNEAYLAEIAERRRAEEAMRQREAQLTEAQRLAHLGSWSWEVKTDSVAWSGELYRIFGRDPESPAPGYKDWEQLHKPESWARLKAAVETALQTGAPYELDLEVFRPDGSKRIIIARGEPDRDGNGEVVQLHGTVQDITERKRAERALVEAQERFRGIYESSKDGIAYTDLNGIFIDVNAAFTDLTAYTKDELRTKKFLDLILEKYHEATSLLVANMIQTGQPLELEQEITRKDGAIIPIFLTSSVVRGNDKKPAGLATVVKDITRHKQVEEKLRQSEEQFRLITENVADLIAVLDLEGRRVYNSPSFKGVLGDPDRLKGTSSFMEIHPDDRDRIKKVFDETVRTGVGQRSEYRFLLRNGSVRYMESQGSVIRDKDGTPTKVVVVSRDVTRRKRVEDTLRENEDRFRMVVQATNDAVWDWDLLTNLFWWNEGVSTLFGYSRDEVGSEATWWTEHIHPEDQERVISGLYQQIDGGAKSWSDEYRFRRKDGSFAFILDRGYIIRDDRGKPVRMIGAKMDDSERKRAEEEIKKLNEGLEQRVEERTAELTAVNETLEQRNREVERMTKLKSQFLASMSHELRTPLNAIIGFADLLQDGTSGDITEKQKKFVKHIQMAGRHLLDLINDILDLSKIEAGQLTIQLENFSADGALPEVLSVIKPLAMKKKIEIRNEVGTGLIVYADRVRFKQIIYNLLSNAVKFTSEGGQVTVESAKIDNFIRFSITDTGIGIKPEDHEAIFEEFRQVGQTTSGVTEGTGLGLAICRRLVVQQEGTIWVESDIGKGSRFSFTLPRGRSISRVAILPSEAAPARPPREKPLILVVDSDATSRELLLSYLAPESFQIEAASSTEEGLTKARRLQPDAIILDILSPEEGGWETLSELKAQSSTSNIPVIVVSILDRKNEGFAQGAAEYLVKPVSKDILVKKLVRHLPSQETSLSTILVVDDHPNTMNLVSDALDSAGYSPVVARSGKEAQEILWRIRVHAILLDLMMPEIDGVELLRRVKENPRLREIPVIVLTAKELTGAESGALKLGARAIIGKDAQWRQEILSHLEIAFGKQPVQS